MNTEDYEKAKQECWARAHYEFYSSVIGLAEVFNRAYDLGMEAAKKEQQSEPQKAKPLTLKPIVKKTAVYLATKEEDEEFRQLLHDNGWQWHNGDSLLKLSGWKQEAEDSKTHFVYPDGRVTYCGSKGNGALTLQEFKDLYTKPKADAEPQEDKEFKNVNSSDIDIDEIVRKGYLPDPTKYFDNIIKDGFRNERRLNIATQILCAIIPKFENGDIGLTISDEQDILQVSCRLANMLIAESDKAEYK